MFVGVARLVLQIPGSRSLKDRRRVVRGLKDRLRGRLPVSVAEVGDLDRHQVATLGVVVVSADARRCQAVLGAAKGLASQLADAVLADVATEVVPFGPGGQGIRGGIEQVLDEEDDFEVDAWKEPEGP